MSDFAAIDLGAESGRVVHGRFDGERVALDVAHRFENRPVRLPDGLHWNLLSLFTEALAGLRAIDAPLAGVGVDTWGVDYALLDGDGRVLGLPFHYRDARTEGMVARAHARVRAEELYAVDRHPDDADQHGLPAAGRRAAPRSPSGSRSCPDLLAYWLSRRAGQRDHQRVDHRAARRARGHLGARADRAARAAGGAVRGRPGRGGHHARARCWPTTASRRTCTLVGSHDTASAFVAAPVRGENAAILSSGTWSLLGLELDAPGADRPARASSTSPTSAASTARSACCAT